VVTRRFAFLRCQSRSILAKHRGIAAGRKFYGFVPGSAASVGCLTAAGPATAFF
jgi:hypothetical protein